MPIPQAVARLMRSFIASLVYPVFSISLELSQLRPSCTRRLLADTIVESNDVFEFDSARSVAGAPTAMVLFRAKAGVSKSVAMTIASGRRHECATIVAPPRGGGGARGLCVPRAREPCASASPSSLDAKFGRAAQGRSRRRRSSTDRPHVKKTLSLRDDRPGHTHAHTRPHTHTHPPTPHPHAHTHTRQHRRRQTRPGRDLHLQNKVLKISETTHERPLNAMEFSTHFRRGPHFRKCVENSIRARGTAEPSEIFRKLIRFFNFRAH